MKKHLIKFLSFALLVSCATTSTSVVSADSYDQEKNVTTLTIIPYGNIEIEGQWTKTSYNEVSRQHFLKDKDSNSVAIALTPMNKYPFYEEGMTEPEFANEFFQWEKEYYEKQNFEINMLESEGQYVIWEAIGKNSNTKFLYGAKNGKAYNLGVFKSKMGLEETKEFLINLFNRN